MSESHSLSSIQGVQQGFPLSRESLSRWEYEINYAREVTRSKHPSAQLSRASAWLKLFKALQGYDVTKIGHYKEDVDTLLVFAGLFSAVLAAFSIESYKLLQPDAGQVSIQLLSQISLQLNAFSVNASSATSSYQSTIPTQLSEFKPSAAVVVLNILWFIALIFCLMTASLGMLVKQWFREYFSNDSTPEASLRIRYNRHRSLERCRLDKPWSFLDPGPLVDESRIRISTEQDEAIWTEADSLFFDDKLVEETAHVCLASLEGPALVRCAQGVVQRRQHNAEPADLSNFGQDSVSLALVNALIRELRVQVVQSGRVEWKPWMGEAYGFMLDTWTYCSSDIGRNYLADFLIATLKQDWPLSEYILRWKPQHSLHVLSFALNDRNDRLKNHPDFDLFYLLKQVLRSVRLLLTLGPLPCHGFNQVPVEPPPSYSCIVGTLFACLNATQVRSRMRMEAARNQTQQFTDEVVQLIDDHIEMALRWVPGTGSNSGQDLRPDEDWGVPISMLRKITNDVKGITYVNFPRRTWMDDLKKLQSNFQANK
ncbi:hypothetical protein NLI96_g1043 [Meripilus lineatus]|uniref:DUF6535 domain-containing protein n=1 Tax=Meripilus lineatus TaxID=2056292 RepID=A0AAD5VD87_9APHY|nr:hypothetical protein NLI96_g1043 [Physisporinus lineatus]